MTVPAAKHPIIALWAVPRSVSTAFERMMAARGDFEVCNEPFSSYYYHGPERVCQRYEAEPPKPEHDPDFVRRGLLRQAGQRPLFFKDMAYHIRKCMSAEFVRPFINAFLIRHPARVLVSLHKREPEFTDEETGYEQLQRLHQIVSETTGQPAPVIDGEILRENPAEVTQAFCKAVGIEFRPEALEWESGGEQHWERWGEWFQDAAQSTGFQQPAPPPDLDAIRRHPRLGEAYERCLPIYEALAEHRIA